MIHFDREVQRNKEHSIRINSSKRFVFKWVFLECFSCWNFYKEYVSCIPFYTHTHTHIIFSKFMSPLKS